MPRTARIKSASPICHVMLRGTNKQQIFYNHEDYEYFMNVLQRVGQIAEMQIYAYCLMGNHVHLLIRAEFGTMQPSPGNAKDRAAFNLSVQCLLRAGISIRQLGRLTGLSKKIIENSK